MIASAGVLAISAIIGVNIFWSVMAGIHDIQDNFYYGKLEAEYIKEHHLDDYKIMTEWQVVKNENDGYDMDTNYSELIDLVSPFLEGNIFYNYFYGDDNICYSTHRRASDEENEKAIKYMKNQGYPDVLIGMPKLSLLFDEEELSYDDYTIVFIDQTNFVWKYDGEDYYCAIFVRNDLLDELGLEKADTRGLPIFIF